MNYQPVIGLEVHVELKTKSKMFCRCNADYFGKASNTHTCPVCLGLPGALPFINEQAIKDCIKIGLALNCQISQKSLFERKNYFYPDLPKGYQISQYRWPLCIKGELKIVGGKVIRVNRAHMEEDTGKLTHQDGETLIDFNRSGVPLVEIVTEPDFSNSAQVRDYAKKLQQIIRYLNVSNADMERGDMRLEANISMRPEGSLDLPNYRVELKNINSFRFMVAAIEYEIKRQTEALQNNEPLVQETRGWNEDKKCTYVQRSKEEANDYRYFPEPDLPELEIKEEEVQSLRLQMPQLPSDLSEKFQNMGIKLADADILSESKELARFFENTVEQSKGYNIDPKDIANYIVNKKVDFEKVSPKDVIEELKNKKADIIEDDTELEKLARQAIDENEKSAADYKSGKENALQALMGGVMKLSKGKADPSKTIQILKRLLN